MSVEVTGAPSAITELKDIQDSQQRLDGQTATIEVEGRGGAATSGMLAVISRQVKALDGKTISIGLALLGGPAAVAALQALGDRLNLMSRTMEAVRAQALPLGSAIGPALGGAATSGVVGILALARALGSGLVGAMVAAGSAAGVLGGAVGLIAAPVAILVSRLDKYHKGLDQAKSAQEAAASTASSYADAQRSAAQQVDSAEQQLDDTRQSHEQTVDSLRASEEELKAVRADEPRRLDELALAEEEAQYRREQAQKAYNEAVRKYGEDSDEAYEASLAFRRAELDAAEASEAHADARENGTQELQSAKEAVTSAREAEEQSAEQVTRAEQNLERVRTEAARSVAQALTAMQQAEADAAAETTKLSAAEQALYNKFIQVRDGATGLFQPAVDSAALLGVKLLDLGSGFVPMFATASTRAVQALNRPFALFRQNLESSGFQQVLQRLLSAIPPVIAQIGTTAARLVPLLVRIFAAALPYGLKLINIVDGLVNRFITWANTVAGEAAIASFFARAWTNAEKLGRVVSNLVVGFMNLTRAASAGGVGDAMLGGLLKLSGGFRSMFEEGTKASGMVREFGRAAVPIFAAVGDAVGTILSDFFRVSLAATKFRQEGHKLTLIEEIFNAIRDASGPVFDMLLEAFQMLGPYIPDLIRNFGGLLNTFAAYTPVLAVYLDSLNKLLGWFNKLPPSVKATTANIVAFGSVVGLLGSPAGTLFGATGGLASLWLNFRLLRGVGAINKTLAATGPAVQGAGAAAATSAGRFGILGAAFRGLGVAIRFMLGPWGLLIAAVAAGVVAIIANWSKIRPALQPVLNVFRQAWTAAKNLAAVFSGVLSGNLVKARQAFMQLPPSLRPLASSLVQLASRVRAFAMQALRFLQQQATRLVAWWRSNWPTISRVATQALQAVGRAIRSVLGPVIRFAISQVRMIVSAVKREWPLISRTAQTVFRAVGAVFKSVFMPQIRLAIRIAGEIVAFIRRNWPQISSVARSVWTIVKTIISTTLKVIGGLIKAGMQAINGNWSGAWKTLQSVAKTISNGISTVVRAFGNILKSIFTVIKNELIRIWQTQIWNPLKAYVDRKRREIESTIQGLKTKALQIFNSLAKPVRKAFEAVGHAMWGPVNAAKNKIEDIIRTVRNIVADVLEAFGQDKLAGQVRSGGGGGKGKPSSDAGGRRPGRGGGRRPRRMARGGVIAQGPTGGIADGQTPRVVYGEAGHEEIYAPLAPSLRKRSDRFVGYYAKRTGGTFIPGKAPRTTRLAGLIGAADRMGLSVGAGSSQPHAHFPPELVRKNARMRRHIGRQVFGMAKGGMLFGVPGGRITADYQQYIPNYQFSADSRHKGIDIAGSEAYATYAGRQQDTPNWSAGVGAAIDFVTGGASKTWSMVHGHLASTPGTGTEIRPNTRLGSITNEGYGWTPHLHLQAYTAPVLSTGYTHNAPPLTDPRNTWEAAKAGGPIPPPGKGAGYSGGPTYSLADRIWLGKGPPPKGWKGVASKVGSAILDFLPGGTLLKSAANAFPGLEKLIPDRAPYMGSGPVLEGIRNFMSGLEGWVKDWVYDTFGGHSGTTRAPVGGDLDEWARQGLDYGNAFEPTSENINKITTLAMKESGGDPSAQNPSGASGLMQMMPETFAAYQVKPSDDIFNAVHNVASSSRYQKDRYGGLVTFSPYSEGGIARKPHIGVFGEGRYAEGVVPMVDDKIASFVRGVGGIYGPDVSALIERLESLEGAVRENKVVGLDEPSRTDIIVGGHQRVREYVHSEENRQREATAAAQRIRDQIARKR